MARQAIIRANSSDSFYIWGGYPAGGSDAQEPRVLWEFTVDGNGGGAWSEATPENPGLFQQLGRTSGAAYASTPEAGFIFGGQKSGPTTQDTTVGHIAMDFRSKRWSRDSRGSYNEDRKIFGGTATYVPNFGPAGVVVVLGGLASDGGGDYVNFEQVHFMDPSTEQWYDQKTSGRVPEDRATHCAVGVAGHNGTYEMYEPSPGSPPFSSNRVTSRAKMGQLRLWRRHQTLIPYKARHVRPHLARFPLDQASGGRRNRAAGSRM